MRKAHMTAALASLVVAASAADRFGAAIDPLPPQSAVMFRLNLAPGQTLYQRSVVQQRVVVTDGEDERITDSTFGTGLKYEVLDRGDAGVHALRVTYDWVRVRTNLVGNPIDYDSAKSMAPETQREVQYAAQVGQTIVITMDEHGKILTFEDLPAMHRRMAQRITELGGRGRAHLPAIRQQFGEESLRDGLGLLEAVLPDTEVEVGGAWEVTSENTAGLARDIDATYRLVEVEGGVAVIAADVIIRPPTRNEEEEEATRGPRQLYELGGSDAGVYRVDLATGWILDAETQQCLKGTTHSRRAETEVVADINISGTTRLTSSRVPPVDNSAGALPDTD